MTKLEIKKGEKYNRLTIIKEVEGILYGRKTIRRFLCKCDCGNKKVISLNHIRSGHIKSCGCLFKEKVSTHRMSGTKIFDIWNNIKSRCNNSKNPRYKDYGGRGIKYEWKSFEDFYKNMGDSYNKHFKENNGNTTIERDNVDGNYNIKNCKWATQKEQARNRRNNVIYKNKCLAEWCEELGLRYGTVSTRIYRGCSIEKALELK